MRRVAAPTRNSPNAPCGAPESSLRRWLRSRRDRAPPASACGASRPPAAPAWAAARAPNSLVELTTGCLRRVATELLGGAGLALAALTHRNGRPLLGIALCGVTSLLVSPISWSHHWVWAVPALVALHPGSGRPPAHQAPRGGPGRCGPAPGCCSPSASSGGCPIAAGPRSAAAAAGQRLRGRVMLLAGGAATLLPTALPQTRRRSCSPRG